MKFIQNNHVKVYNKTYNYRNLIKKLDYNWEDYRDASNMMEIMKITYR